MEEERSLCGRERRREGKRARRGRQGLRECLRRRRWVLFPEYISLNSADQQLWARVSVPAVLVCRSVFFLKEAIPKDTLKKRITKYDHMVLNYIFSPFFIIFCQSREAFK